MKKGKYILIVLIIFSISFSWCLQQEMLAKLTPLERQLSALNLKNIDSLMIVAHPDDETIWAGDKLRRGNYLVVCLTNQNNQIRATEFMHVMEETSNIGVILDYPDKTKGQRDNWETVKKGIKKDIKTLLNEKKWKQIVTHNPEGEYGHIHHKMTSTFVREEVCKTRQEEHLYYFGKYVPRSQLHNEKRRMYLNHPLRLTALQEKQKLVKQYESQGKVMKKLQHMFPYENFIAYKDWKAS